MCVFIPLKSAQFQKIHRNEYGNKEQRICTQITVYCLLRYFHFSLLLTFVESYLCCYLNMKLIYSPGLQPFLASSPPAHPVYVSQSAPTWVPLHLLFLPSAVFFFYFSFFNSPNKIDWKTNAKCLKSQSQKSRLQFWQHEQFFIVGRQKQAVNSHRWV